jgi:hypothetical protein
MQCIRACDLYKKICEVCGEYVGKYVFSDLTEDIAISIDPPDNDRQIFGNEIIILMIPNQTIERKASLNQVYRYYTYCLYVVRHDDSTETIANFENLIFLITKLSPFKATVTYMPSQSRLATNPSAKICISFQDYDI